MTQNIQLDLFEPVDEISILRTEIASLREDINTLRKSQFARLNALGKLIVDSKKLKKKTFVNEGNNCHEIIHSEKKFKGLL